MLDLSVLQDAVGVSMSDVFGESRILRKLQLRNSPNELNGGQFWLSSGHVVKRLSIQAGLTSFTVLVF